jgi:phenylpropionate dioxygenase-like ring-hydroxylating dioxygenase large terminal subunit
MCGDHLACGYHGLKFDVSGRCVEVPGQSLIPRGAKVRSYPVCEKWGAVWIWMGEPARADASKVPSLPWLADPKWTATPGYIHLKSNYQFLIDNLLDLTHVSYVHKKTLAGDPREATTPTKTCGTIGDAVMATFLTPDHALAAALKMREAQAPVLARRCSRFARNSPAARSGSPRGRDLRCAG